MATATDHEMVVCLNAAIAKWTHDIMGIRRLATETRCSPASFIAYLDGCAIQEGEVVDFLRRTRDEYLTKIEGDLI